MAVRIPVYERHVQLDAAAQTMPRFTADTSLGRALTHTGDEMMKVAAHWKAKQDGFDKMQLRLSDQQLHEQIQQIITEETTKYDPLNEKPGVLHDRINARIAPLITKFIQDAPESQKNEAAVHGKFRTDQAGTYSVVMEQDKRNRAVVTEVDKEVGRIKQSLEHNPDGHKQAVQQLDKLLNDTAAFANFTPEQIARLRKAGLISIHQSALKGYATQGRNDEGEQFNREFTRDRQAEQAAQVNEQRAKVAEQAKTSVDPKKYETKLTPSEEADFKKWKQTNAPQDSGQDYDWRGAWKAGVEKDAQGHWPDTFKKPNHPTFSDQSQYAKDRPDLAGTWDGDKFIPPKQPAAGEPAAGTPLPRPKPENLRSGFVEPIEPDRPTKVVGSPDAVPPSGTVGSPDAVQMAAFVQEQPAGADRRVASGEDRPVNDTGYNAKRVAEIDAKPQIARLLEQVATETGMDPNMLKVAASIESSGNPKAKTGDHVGLFQLTKAEIGMHGGGDREDPRANALAFVSILQKNALQLKKETGREPSAEELYLSHNQGVGGTIAHMKNPDQPAWKTLLATSEGQQKGEEWAKKAVAGNIPGDVLRRNFGGDATKVSSSDLLAIKGTQVSGGDVDFAIQMRRDDAQPTTVPKRIVVASADGNYVNDTSPTFVGGMNVGGPVPSSQYVNLPGYRTGPDPGGVVSLGERGAHGYSGQGRLQGVNVAPWLVDSVKEASKVLPPGYRAEVISSVDERKTGTVWHPTGRAIDVQIYDDKGNKVPNVGNERVPGWELYHNMAAAAHAYAQDQYGQKLTWGGHFNSGTPYDRMHFQVGGDSARRFTPDQVQQGRTLLAGAVPSPDTVEGGGAGGDFWERQYQTGKTYIEGSGQKASSVKRAMNDSIKQAIIDDHYQIRTKGEQAPLSPEQQKYYKTDKLSYEMISNHLGEGAAIAWSEGKQMAEKFYQHTRNMPEMSKKIINENLAALGTSLRNPSDERLYTQVNKEASRIFKARDQDPAGEAMKYSAAAKAAYEELLKDPTNQDKIKALIDARYKAMKDWGVEETRQSPLTNDEARRLAMPLKDLADPDINRVVAGKQVAQTIYDYARGDRKTSEDALRKVLEVAKVSREVAASTAQALKDIRLKAENDLAEKSKPAAPAAASTKKQIEAYDTMYGIPGLESSQPLPEEVPRQWTAQDRSRASFGEHGAFDPVGTYIPPAQMKDLLDNKDNPLAVEIFNQTYGSGAAEHVLRGGKVVATDPYAPKPNSWYVDPKVDYPNYQEPQTVQPVEPPPEPVSWPKPLGTEDDIKTDEETP